MDFRPFEGRTSLQNEEVAELSLLLPGWEVRANGGAGPLPGLDLGQLIRRLIHHYLADRASLDLAGEPPIGGLATLPDLHSVSQDASP